MSATNSSQFIEISLISISTKLKPSDSKSGTSILTLTTDSSSFTESVLQASKKKTAQAQQHTVNRKTRGVWGLVCISLKAVCSEKKCDLVAVPRSLGPIFSGENRRGAKRGRSRGPIPPQHSGSNWDASIKWGQKTVGNCCARPGADKIPGLL